MSNINNPDHYQSDKIETIDIIEAFKLNFRLGNVVKYILRSGKKGNRLEDLKKAQWYLNREIEKEATEKQEQADKLQAYERLAQKYNSTDVVNIQTDYHSAERVRQAIIHADETEGWG